MISGIFQYLTRKQVNNSLTPMPYKSPQDLFMEQRNISKISAYMYNSMKIVNRPDYMKYRDKIQYTMHNWIWKQFMPDVGADQNEHAKYTTERLSNNFIVAYKYLIETPNVMYANAPKIMPMAQATQQINYGHQTDNFYDIAPENIYRDKFNINTRDNDGNLVKGVKKGGDMMPWDYQNYDVWKKQETYADFDFEKFRSFRDQYGYAGTYIPRNVDRDPETFGLVHRDPARASLSDVPRAYDNTEYMRAKGIR